MPIYTINKKFRTLLEAATDASNNTPYFSKEYFEAEAYRQGVLDAGEALGQPIGCLLMNEDYRVGDIVGHDVPMTCGIVHRENGTTAGYPDNIHPKVD